MDKQHGAYTITTAKAGLDLELIHSYLTNCYWAKGIPEETVRRSIEHSLCFGVFLDAAQVGFARAITDYATFMYLADVFILPDHQGQGLGVALIDVVVTHPDLQGIRTWTLLTADAHGLYEKFGFEVPADPGRFMRRKVAYPYPKDD